MRMAMRLKATIVADKSRQGSASVCGSAQMQALLPSSVEVRKQMEANLLMDGCREASVMWRGSHPRHVRYW